MPDHAAGEVLKGRGVGIAKSAGAAVWKVRGGGVAKVRGGSKLLGDFRLISLVLAVIADTSGVSVEKACEQSRDMFKRTTWSMSCWQLAGSITPLFAHCLLYSFYWTQVEWHGLSSGNNSRGSARSISSRSSRSLPLQRRSLRICGTTHVQGV